MRGVVATALFAAACGAGDAGGGSDGRPPPGPSADGWSSDYVDGSAGISCDDDPAALAASAAVRVSIGDSTLYGGYEQIGDNQNPVLARVDGDSTIWCAVHETEGPDSRIWGLTWDGGDTAYLVYTTVGGGSSLEGHGGWLGSYAPGAISGGGPRVSVLGRVTTVDGALDRATFIIAVKSDNKVNSHSPMAAPTVLESGEVAFYGGSAHKPIDASGASAMDCSDYPFDTEYRFSADLGELRCASSSNCESARQCN